MFCKTIRPSTVVLIALVVGTAAGQRQTLRHKRVSLLGIGNDQPGYVTRAYDLSADGNVVVGTNELDPFTNALVVEQAFAWNRQAGKTNLGFLDGLPPASAALGVSSDGGAIVGRSWSDGFKQQGALWNKGTVPFGLGFLDDMSHTEATAASEFGNFVVGTNQFRSDFIDFPPFNRAFRWSAKDEVMEDIGSLTPFGDSYANDISSVGSVIVGRATSPVDPSNPLIRDGFSHEATIWKDGEILGLGHYDYDPADVPNAYLESNATAVSSGGDYVVGNSSLIQFNGQPDLFNRAFIWSEDGGIEDLGDFPFDVCCMEYVPVDVSADGLTVIGNATLVTDEPEFTEPFIWTRDGGMRALSEYLVTEFGVSDLGGWDLGEVAAISDNGLTIAGTGINPKGVQEAYQLRMLPSFLATDVGLPQAIPEPASASLFVGSLLMASFVLRCRRSRHPR